MAEQQVDAGVSGGGFTGLPFCESHPFSPEEAAPYLHGAMDAIRKRKRLLELGVDPSLPGRGGIKLAPYEVWDFLRLARSRSKDEFTAYPHFTLAFRPEEVVAVLILPNKWLDRKSNRTPLECLGQTLFNSIIQQVADGITHSMGDSVAARPWILVQQRRWAHGRAKPPVFDALLQFDPRTGALSAPQCGSEPLIKLQPQWICATYEALISKHSNLELVVGARFDYGTEITRSAALLDRVIDGWAACLPLLHAVTAENIKPSDWGVSNSPKVV